MNINNIVIINIPSLPIAANIPLLLISIKGALFLFIFITLINLIDNQDFVNKKIRQVIVARLDLFVARFHIH